MFFSSIPNVEFVELAGNQVVLLSDKPLQLGREISVQSWLRPAPSDKPQRVALRVYLHQFRRVNQSQLGYFGTLQSELAFQPVPSSLPDSAPVRRYPRQDCYWRVLSPGLPNYTALSVDFSLSGLQVETREALILGQVIGLHLEAPAEAGDGISLKARVAWCHRKNHKAFRCGLEFRDLTPETLTKLRQLETYLRLRETSEVTQFVVDSSVT